MDLTAFRAWVAEQAKKPPSEASGVDFAQVVRALARVPPAVVREMLAPSDLDEEDPKWLDEERVLERKKTVRMDYVSAQAELRLNVYGPSLRAVVTLEMTPIERVQERNGRRTNHRDVLRHSEAVEIQVAAGPYTTVDIADAAFNRFQFRASYEGGPAKAAQDAVRVMRARLEPGAEETELLQPEVRKFNELMAIAKRSLAAEFAQPPVVYVPAYTGYMMPAVLGEILHNSEDKTSLRKQERWMLRTDLVSRLENAEDFLNDVHTGILGGLKDNAPGLSAKSFQEQLDGGIAWLEAAAKLIPPEEVDPPLDIAVLRRETRKWIKEDLETHAAQLPLHRAAAHAMATHDLNRAREELDKRHFTDPRDAAEYLEDFVALLTDDDVLAHVDPPTQFVVGRGGRLEEVSPTTADWITHEEMEPIRDSLRAAYAHEFRELAGRLADLGFRDLRTALPEPPDTRTLNLFARTERLRAPLRGRA